MNRIVIAEPSTMLRIGLEQLLHELPDAEVVFSTDNLNSLYARINALHPDILIVNPLLFDYAKRATLRAEFDQLPNLRLVGLVTAYLESQHQRQFAGVIELNDDIQRMIFEASTTRELRARARELGMRTLREDGIRKVLAGVTTIEEVLRVTMGDED